MLMTLLLSGVMMAGLFLMLFAAVAFVQDKRLFTSAPKDIQAALKKRDERFPGAHAIGWLLIVLSLVMMIGAIVYGGWDGLEKGFGFWQFFSRFLVMLLLLKAFDILFFDWYLLCHSNFFPHFYPECAILVGPQCFGFNTKSHVLQILTFPVISLIITWSCMSIF